MKRGFVLKAHSVTTLLFVPDSLFCYSVILHNLSLFCYISLLSIISPFFEQHLSDFSSSLCYRACQPAEEHDWEQHVWRRARCCGFSQRLHSLSGMSVVWVDNVSELGQVFVSCFCLTMLSLHHGNTSYAVLVFSHRSDAASYSLIDKVFTLSHSLIVTKSSLKAPQSFCSCRKDSYNHY